MSAKSWRRLSRVALSILFLVVLVVPTVGQAGAAGRVFSQSSGTLSSCAGYQTAYEFRSNANNWFEYARGVATGWTLQTGQQGSQLYAARFVYHSHPKYFNVDGDMKSVYHDDGEMNLYPVSSTSSDPALATGWYEGRYVWDAFYANSVDNWVFPTFAGHMTAVGRGDFAGQTVQGTIALHEWWPQKSLCLSDQQAQFNLDLALQFTGKP